jgi:1,4-dihydroxy-2-naphthoate octaprenyltransferase
MDRTPLDIIVPVLMGCALLVWYTRYMSWTRRLAITAVTLAIVLVVLLLERSGL